MDVGSAETGADGLAASPAPQAAIERTRTSAATSVAAPWVAVFMVEKIIGGCLPSKGRRSRQARPNGDGAGRSDLAGHLAAPDAWCMQSRSPLHATLPEVADGAGRLIHLGFLLISPFPPNGGATPSRLFVSLRPRPTQQHFDVERVSLWTTGTDRRGHPEELTARSAMPLERSYAWGKIELVDRLGAENDFVTMGGSLVADRIDDEEVVAVFTSPAPILRMGGHSQADDVVALEMAAFFARMMVPIDFNPVAEPALAAADPLVRYAAFVAFQRQRYLGHLLLRDEHPKEAEIIGEEAERLPRSHPDAWQRGRRLLEVLALRG